MENMWGPVKIPADWLIVRVLKEDIKMRKFINRVTAVPLTFMDCPETQAATTITGTIDSGDMNWGSSTMTRCKYIHVRSDAASMRHTVMVDDPQFVPHYLFKS